MARRPVFYGRLGRIEVEGLSMIPALLPGDRLLIVPFRRLAVGDLVALRDPEEASRLLIKRVERLEARGVTVRGDNASASRDSREFGVVPLELLAGRVLYRYFDRGRQRQE
jgi:nickel-type superoxide dismutase maturation protease